MAASLPGDAFDIIIVGGGRAGCHLAHALSVAALTLRDDAEAPRIALVCRSQQRRARVTAWVAADVLRAPIQVVAGVAECEAPLVVLAVPDRHLADCAREFADQQRSANPSVWLHLSGVASPETIRVPGLSVAVGSLHPLCALPDPLDAPQAIDARPLQGALCAIAGDLEALRQATRLVAAVGGRPIQVPEPSRPAYHAAAALVANDLVALLHLGEILCASAGLSADAARSGLLHLMRTSLDAVAAVPNDAPLALGLTGAVSRGDASTLARHLEALAAQPDAHEIHRLLSQVLVLLVERAGSVEPAALVAMQDVLSDRHPTRR
ncbi:MAG: DUF2520 domain-containing protein [Myxococcota bacterium]